MYLLHICTKKKQPFGKGTPNRGCSYITSAAGGEGVRQILTIADEGGMGGLPNADFCWRGEGGGLRLQFCFTNGFKTTKKMLKRNNICKLGVAM